MMEAKKKWRAFREVVRGVLLGVLLSVAGPAAWAQSACDEAVAIPEAEKLYSTGNFDQVFALLKPCAEAGFGESGRIQAYKLLSMSYLAIDSLNQSSRTLAQLLALNPKFEADFSASPRYKALVAYVRASREQVVQVTSVSKRAENILYAPATVQVITSREIEQRGYQNIEQLFHDLPGFDMIRGNGVVYSIFYQRGYRSDNNDRTLILIDGVEENDLVSNQVILSPQYALSDIDRVEVIYGAASTLYGANAFTGVINIITKSFRNQPGPGRMVGVTAHTRVGTYNTRYLDAVVAARTPDVTLTLTARAYTSAERDLSGFPEWNYGPRTAADYGTLLDLKGPAAKNYLATPLPPSDLYTVDYEPGTTTPTAIRLTQAGAEKAARLDNQLFGNKVKGNPVEFSDNKRDWLIRGKLEFKDLTISYLDWKTNESNLPWYGNRTAVPSGGNPRWITHDRAVSITYTKQFSEKFQLLNLASYLLHEIDGGTTLNTYNGYYNRKFSFRQLLADSAARSITTYYYRVSTQFRNELRLFWSPLYNLDINGGLEGRSGLIQGNYLTSLTEFADETGALQPGSVLPGGNNFRTFDVGLYGQANYRPTKNLKLVAGVRIDNNTVRRTGGYGTVANPRLAAIYGLGKFVVKAIYAQAFKDASFLQKYGTTTTRTLNNPTLQPEQVRNYEVSLFFQATKRLSANVVAYQADYSNAVGTATVRLENGTATQQFQGIGRRRIQGIQAEASYKAGLLNVWWNGTYTNPVDKLNGLRVSDIADYMANMGADYRFGKLGIYLAGNLVGPRRSGAGTSGSSNPQTSFDPFFVLNTNLTYHQVVNGLSLQFSVSNLLDKEYAVPGVRAADVFLFASRLPQDRRFFSLGASYTLPTPGIK